MTFGGWLTLILSVGFVTGLFLWCIGRVLWQRPPIDHHHLHGIEDIDTRDTSDE